MHVCVFVCALSTGVGIHVLLLCGPNSRGPFGSLGACIDAVSEMPPYSEGAGKWAKALMIAHQKLEDISPAPKPS